MNETYNALLSDDEDEAVLDCGCTLHRPFAESGQPCAVAITFCAMHENAARAVDVLEWITRGGTMTGPLGLTLRIICDETWEIAKAEVIASGFLRQERTSPQRRVVPKPSPEELKVQKKLAARLLEWHGGMNSGLYAVGSCMLSASDRGMLYRTRNYRGHVEAFERALGELTNLKRNAKHPEAVTLKDERDCARLHAQLLKFKQTSR